MVYGLWQSAAGLQAQQYRQAVITNNLANTDTPGFKPDRVAFTDRLNAARNGGPMSASHPTLDPLTGGIFSLPVYTDFGPGSLDPTQNPLDVAIVGDGFLSVRTPDGVRYTRDGRMIANADGALIHVGSGGAVLDADGTPLVLDPNSTEKVQITADGLVKQGRAVVGRLALVDFANKADLEKSGGNLFAANGARPIDSKAEIRQGSGEASAAEATTTLVDMIAATRAYEINASVLSMQDDTLGRLVNEVGRLG